MNPSQQLKEYLDDGWIHCALILEILGKPAEHVTKALDLLLSRLSEDKKVLLVEKKIHPPKEEKGFFSTFAEVEIGVKDTATLTSLCFDYLPSSLEVIAPENIPFEGSTLSDFLNDLLAQLHQIDMRLKNTVLSNNLLNDNLYALLKNFVKQLSFKKPVSLSVLSNSVGIEEKKLLPFLERMKQEQYLLEENKTYSVNNVRSQ